MTDLDALLTAIVERGNSYSQAVARSDGPEVSFDVARTEPEPAGGDAVVVSFTYRDAGGARRLEYRIPADDSLLGELARGEEDADGAGTIIAVNLWEEIDVIGVDAAIANGTFRVATG